MFKTHTKLPELLYVDLAAFHDGFILYASKITTWTVARQIEVAILRNSWNSCRMSVQHSYVECLCLNWENLCLPRPRADGGPAGRELLVRSYYQFNTASCSKLRSEVWSGNLKYCAGRLHGNRLCRTFSFSAVSVCALLCLATTSWVRWLTARKQKLVPRFADSTAVHFEQ